MAVLGGEHRGSPAKGRSVGVLQLMAGGVMCMMCVVVMYMYRVIDTMQRDQQAMRMHIEQLRGSDFHSLESYHESPPRPEFNSASTRDDAFLRDEHAFLSEEERRMPETEPADGFVPWTPSFREGPLAAADRRKLGAMMTIGTAATSGCFQISDSSAVTYDMSSSIACNNNICPDCFITPSSVSQAITLTVSSCTTAKWIRSSSRAGVWAMTFINTHSSYTMSVVDSTGALTYKVPALSYVQAYCSSSQGTSNRLMFPSTTMPTLSVDSGFTLSAGNFVASGSSGTFATTTGTNTLGGNVVISGSKTLTTGTGAVSLNGATTVAASKAFTVGTAASGGATILYGTLAVGGSSSGQSTSMTLYGDFTQTDSGTDTIQTFATATGAIKLNGDVTVASAKNLHMTAAGTGTFQTGAGDVTLYGNTNINGAKTFATGTGTVSLNGATTVAASTAFTVGTAGAGGASTMYGTLTVGGSSTGESTGMTLYGDFTQTDSGADTIQTFATATGAISLNGDITVASAKDFAMTGAGTFSSGTGTVSLNGDTTVTGSKTFATGSGSVSLNGATTVADSKTFTVGSPGAGGGTQLFGTVVIGGSASTYSTSLLVYGNVGFQDDANGVAKTFSTATGGITMNGNLGLAANVNFHQTGTGTFTTGTGAVTIKGDATVTNSGNTNTFVISAYTSPIICNHAITGDASATFCRASR